MTRSLAVVLLCLLGPPGLGAAPERPRDAQAQRERMVERQIAGRGVQNPRVLEAMRRVPRHLFVPSAQRAEAYQDRALPIGKGQTISQPYVVARMTELLEPEVGDRILEVGTGSGYQAAVLAELVGKVYSIEIVPELAEAARARLAAQGYENVVVIAGDGYRGLPGEAPFDGIIVTAAPKRVPEPLLDQLARGGRLVIPVGGKDQFLQVFERTEQGIQKRELFPVRFVPMTGEAETRD